MQTDYYFLVMEYCPDGDLRKLISQKKRLSEKFDTEQVVEWSLQVAAALKFCHDHKVIHRDLKVSIKLIFWSDFLFQPENIFLVYQGRRAKLADFGLARETDGSSMQASTQAGTFPYMAPELLKSKPF